MSKKSQSMPRSFLSLFNKDTNEFRDLGFYSSDEELYVARLRALKRYSNNCYILDGDTVPGDPYGKNIRYYNHNIQCFGSQNFDSSFKKGGSCPMANKANKTTGRKRYVTGYSENGYTHLTIYPVNKKKNNTKK